jgi:hypothetical protein
MDKKNEPNAMGLAFKKTPPQSVDAGSEISFSVSAKWPEGFGPEGTTYLVRDGKRTILSAGLPNPAEDGSVALTLAAPEEIGEHRWTLVVSCASKTKGERAEGSLPLTFTTIPHATSLAVWDTPSPVVRGRSFAVKVGAKCTASCHMGGKTIEIHDEAGTLMGTGALGNETWEKTASLYWTSVPLKAPRKLGPHSWTVSFSPAELKLPHAGTVSRFSFVTVVEPAHSVTVKIVDKQTKTPISGAQVRLGLYRAVTDEKGSAMIAAPRGEFPLIVTRAGYKETERSIQVSKDVSVRIGAEPLPEEDLFAHWTA